jgi:hypothetical protein
VASRIHLGERSVQVKPSRDRRRAVFETARFSKEFRNFSLAAVCSEAFTHRESNDF